MALIRKLIDRIRGTHALNPAGPHIKTQWGDVTESARRQAAINMKNDPFLRERVLALVVKEMGGNEVAGLREFKRRYPEAGLEDSK